LVIIGIDPGTLHFGWGVIRADGTRLLHVAHGVIHTSPGEAFAERLCAIDEALAGVLEEYHPEEAAVESLFFGKDAQAASKLGHARGVALVRLARSHLEVHEYAPARVKRAVAGRGLADKRQVALMVRTLLGLREAPAFDAADALAVAIAHAHVSRVDRALAAASGGRR
jgi:crossover junction endodeoxyribonuclease RuvC